MTITARQALRYALWAQVLITANANRRYFGLPTTWVYHTAGNTIALLLPELYTALARLGRLETRAGRLAPLHAVMRDAVRDNPRYLAHVAPLALAYIVSHPRFNIYKGDWAARQVLGFSFDSIPHATTAFGLTRFIGDTLDALTHHLPPGAPASAPARWAAAHRVLVTGVALAIVTALYETGEWLIHTSELRATGGDTSRINMEWSELDTLTDAIANLVGWLLAIQCPA